MAKLPKETGFAVPEEPKEEKRKPVVFLQVPFDEAKDLDIGDSVSVTFKGKIVGTSMSKRKKQTSHAEIDVEDPQISVKQKSGQISELDEDFDT